MKQINLRLPDDLHAALKVLAEHEQRSLHGQILHALRVYAIPRLPEGDGTHAQR